MRNVLKNKLHFRTIWMSMLAIMTVAMTSCLDDDNGTVVPRTPTAYVTLYHGAPGLTDVDVYADANKIGFNGFEYSDFSGYMPFHPGERDLKVTPYNAANSLADTTVNLKADSLYSVFIAGNDANAVELMVIEDNIPDEEAGKALIRVVHLSPDAPAFNLAEDDDNSTAVFEDVAFKEVSEFKQIDAGKTSFEVLSGADEELLTSVDNFDFVEGRVYTLIVRGFANPPAGNTNSLSVQVQPYYFSY